MTAAWLRSSTTSAPQDKQLPATRRFRFGADWLFEKIRSFAGTTRTSLRCWMMEHERIVAIGLLTRKDLSLLGPTFDRAWPVDEAPHFRALLQQIDDVDTLLQERKR